MDPLFPVGNGDGNDCSLHVQIRSLRRGLHDVLGPRAGALWLFSPLESGSQVAVVHSQGRSEGGPAVVSSWLRSILQSETDPCQYMGIMAAPCHNSSIQPCP